MKNQLLTILILTMGSFVACESDEEDADNLLSTQNLFSGSVNFQGVQYEINDGFYTSEFDSSSGFLISSFALADGEIRPEDSTFNGNFVATIATFSSGSSFRSGIYPLYFLFNFDDRALDTLDQFASIAVVGLDGSDTLAGFSADGSVTITKSEDHNYSFIFDADLIPSGRLTGAAAGTLPKLELDE